MHPSARVVVGVLVVHAVCFAVGPWAFVQVGGGAVNAQQQLTVGELAWYPALYVVALLLGDAGWKLPGDGRAFSARERGMWTAVALVAVLVAGLFSGWHPLTDDEQAYSLQARLLSQGQFVEPQPAVAVVSENPFLVTRVTDAGTVWTGCYPFLAGALSLPGYLVGFEGLLWMLIHPLLVWNGSVAAREWLGERADERLVAAMLALSPQLAFLCTARHTGLLAALFTVGVFRLALRFPSPWAALGAGVLFGGIVHARPVESTVVLLLFGAAWLWHVDRAAWRSWAATPLWVGLGGAGPLALWLAMNHAVTGHATELPYSLLTDGSVYGFGQTAFGYHSVGLGMLYVGLAWGRAAVWALGPAVPLIAVVSVLEARSTPDASGLLRTRWPWLFAAGLVHFAIYLPAPFGSTPTAGPVYQSWLIPLAAGWVALAALTPAAAGRLRTLWWANLAAVWPWAAWTAYAVGSLQMQPVELAEARPEAKITVLYEQWRPFEAFAGQALTPPMSTDAIWYVRESRLGEVPGAPERALFRLEWSTDMPPAARLVPVER